MFKIPKLKRAYIPLIYLIVFIILVVVSFLPAYEIHYPSPYSSFGRVLYYYGWQFTFFPLIFYLIGVILIYYRKTIASIIVSAIGNAILILTIVIFLVEVANIRKGTGYAIKSGFFIIVSLLIVLIIINILMFVYKADLSTKPLPVQPVNN